MSEIHGKWGYSTDGKTYFGSYDFAEEAEVAGRQDEGWETQLWVGQFTSPRPPEDFIDIDHFLEGPDGNEDYSGDYVDWPPSITNEQREELKSALAKVYGDWLDKHDKRPDWGLVTTVKACDPHCFGSFTGEER